MAPTNDFASLREAAVWYDDWLRVHALPLWWNVGADHARGGFLEALSLEGEPRPAPRRGRVQGRQIFTYALAGMMGWDGPWREAAWCGVDYMLAHFQREDGLIRTLVGLDGEPIDETAMLYDQAFAILGLATLHRVDPGRIDLVAEGDKIRHGLQSMRHVHGGFRENIVQPFQANAHMHLLEAAMAWGEAGEPSWDAMADEIVEAALNTFIDPDGGFLREFFDEGWRPAVGDEGRLVEPGHQFEWAWLLERWGRQRGRGDARAAARRLFAIGRKGVDPLRRVAVNELWDDLTLRDGTARLWPQTEHLKAALILDDLDAALEAANGLRRYLETPRVGVWRDKMGLDGHFQEGPAPATSLYHLITACKSLSESQA
ncbi:MAG: AGE family epimerase/isomerase [Phenylobacterium sp.]|uniref:AGE family epimerase/isomerase n=1 Tax=Phenylobacterium sp. TaxID=1871053 RepID=UPI003BB641BB